MSIGVAEHLVKMEKPLALAAMNRGRDKEELRSCLLLLRTCAVQVSGYVKCSGWSTLVSNDEIENVRGQVMGTRAFS